VKYRYEEEESCLGKLNQNTLPLFTRLDKMEKKIEAMETIEFTRLKNNLRNNESMAVTLPLHQMLIGLDKA
jgi:GTP cyclohydrolase III